MSNILRASVDVPYIILLESNLNPTVKVLALTKSERTRDKQKVFYAFLMKVMAATSVVQFSTTHTDFFPKITYILLFLWSNKS